MMIKRFCLIVSLFFLLFPSVSIAQLTFQEDQKVWQDHSASEYDRVLGSAAVSFPDRFRVSTNPGMDLGPVSIRLDGFRGGNHPYFDYWVRVQPLPNIYLDNQISVRLVIEHIWDFEQNDLYNREEASHQSIQDIAGDKALTFMNKLYLKRGSDADQIQEIQGEMVFYLPLKLTWITFEGTDLKKEKPIPATSSRASLSKLRFNGKRSWVEIFYQGQDEAYITSLGYDKMGKQLKKKGFAKNSISGGWHYAYAFEGKVEKVQTLISSHAIQRRYPFKITP